MKSVFCDCCLGFTTSQSARTFQCETQLEMSARRQRRKPLGSQASVMSSEWAASQLLSANPVSHTSFGYPGTFADLEVKDYQRAF